MEALERTNLVLAKVLELAMDKGISHWSLEFSDLGLDQEYSSFFFRALSGLNEKV
jgi:hypothetical protein